MENASLGPVSFLGFTLNQARPLLHMQLMRQVLRVLVLIGGGSLGFAFFGSSASANPRLVNNGRLGEGPLIEFTPTAGQSQDLGIVVVEDGADGTTEEPGFFARLVGGINWPSWSLASVVGDALPDRESMTPNWDWVPDASAVADWFPSLGSVFEDVDPSAWVTRQLTSLGELERPSIDLLDWNLSGWWDDNVGSLF